MACQRSLIPIGSQFTSTDFTKLLKGHEIRISMDGNMVRAQAGGDFVIEPGVMAELYRMPRLGPGFKRPDELLQAFHVFAKRPRQLPDDGRQLFTQAFGMIAFEANRRQWAGEFLVVCQETVALDGEAEIGRRRVAPAAEGFLVLQAVKTGIDFYAVETLSAESQPVFAWNAAVEIIVSRSVIPAAGADVGAAGRDSSLDADERFQPCHLARQPGGVGGVHHGGHVLVGAR